MLVLIGESKASPPANSRPLGVVNRRTVAWPWKKSTHLLWKSRLSFQAALEESPDDPDDCKLLLELEDLHSRPDASKMPPLVFLPVDHESDYFGEFLPIQIREQNRLSVLGCATCYFIWKVGHSFERFALPLPASLVLCKFLCNQLQSLKADQPRCGDSNDD